MEKGQENQVRTLYQVESVFDENQIKIAGKPKLMLRVGDLKTVTAAIREQASIQRSTTTGKVDERDIDFDDAVDETMAAMGALYLMAEDEKDEALKQYASAPKSDFTHGPKEASITRMLDVVEKIRPKVPLMADYDYLPEDFDSLIAKTGKLRGSQSGTYSSLAHQKAATQTLPELIDEGMVILRSIDRHMKIMEKRDAAFARLYFSARDIKDLGIRHEEEEETPSQPVTPEPVG